ncbi:MAG: 4-(cytidine 5'-diphospho)-2-C-methyl-D-erythritol kinase [Armatimonadetes bacterium]|nr:4-(cytidine 5'-diphospho)-2-C-methyl-D-erythritol kinase [Armatimonadota bacterium]
MTLRAYAKLNLLLRVLRRRSDGYHDLLSVMQTVSLHDLVTLEPTETEGIRLTASDPALPTDERNLAHRAAMAFYGRLGLEPYLALHLEKRIPMRAGLGGGSSDAAAVLTGLNRIFGGPLEARELHALAATIGSDVPFFLRGGGAVAEGRGERLTSLPPFTSMHAVLVCPGFGVETPWAYARVTPKDSIPAGLSALLASERLEWDSLIPFMTNDLEPPVKAEHPEIETLENRLTALGARHAMMTGSGSTVFGLFAGPEETTRATEAFERDGIRAYAVTATMCGSESVPSDADEGGSDAC